MKNFLSILFLWISLFSQAANSGDQVTHVQKVYKTVGNQELKVDIFYAAQSFERENNTAIVFFMEGAGLMALRVNFSPPANAMRKWGL